MRASLLSWLACPDCGGDIKFKSLDSFPHDDADLETGTLACARCRREFPIVGGIPQLYPKGTAARAVRRTSKAFAWEWLRYPGAMPEDRTVFLEETQVAEADWSGRQVLDAGCGMGRYALVARSLGAGVIAFDLSESITRLRPRAKKDLGLHLVNGDLLRPPFKPAVFDIAYSSGVLHHTRSTEAAFKKVAPLVKKDGLLAVWLYGRPGSWKSFSTNPLKSTRTWLRRLLFLVWIVVGVRQFLSDSLRVLTTRMPMSLLYALCYPLAFLGMFPLVKYLTFSVHPDFRVRVQENFDWLAPPYQWKHTKEELRSWFEHAGFAVISQLPHGVVPKVGALGVKK